MNKENETEKVAAFESHCYRLYGLFPEIDVTAIINHYSTYGEPLGDAEVRISRLSRGERPHIELVGSTKNFGRYDIIDTTYSWDIRKIVEGVSATYLRDFPRWERDPTKTRDRYIEETRGRFWEAKKELKLIEGLLHINFPELCKPIIADLVGVEYKSESLVMKDDRTKSNN